MKNVGIIVVLLFVCVMGTKVHAADYTSQPAVTEFVKKMVKNHKFKAEEITSVLNKAERKQNILDAIAKPAEKTKPWYEYRNIFLGQDRIDQGVAFWQENRQSLEDAEKTFGVDAKIIVAIIGVETRYGRHMGSYRVVDALATLGFDYEPRSQFFLGQLEELFLLAREQKHDPLSLTGSYAGAMGFGQFIPSSYRAYAKDFDDDGFADIWNNKRDAIGSVANYFKAHGWQTGRPTLIPATLTKKVDPSLIDVRSRPEVSMSQWLAYGIKSGQKLDANEKAVLLGYQQPERVDYWLGLNNFYVITRYNRSQMYAMAVWELSEAIAEARQKTSAKKN